MALQIVEFKGAAALPVGILQLPDGPPSAVNNAANGSYTVGASTVLIKISGTGTITWPGLSTPETFDGVEFRRVRPSDTFTVG